jgi:hypothetical protein
MHPSTSMARWETLRQPGDRLAEARLQCHHAVQLNTRLARGFVPARSDDSHTSLTWDFAARALMGEPVSSFRPGLQIADLKLVLPGASGERFGEFPLDGRTFEEARGWLGDQLRSAGLDPAPLAQPIHFELDDHPLLHGARFALRAHEPFFDELAKWYSNAAGVLESIASPVRCWPHHFDIGALIAEGDRSIGVGLSPGDSNYSQPYFYVTPWPYPEPDRLPDLPAGNWHTRDWIGAVLRADEILARSDQRDFVRSFLDNAIGALGEMHAQESSERPHTR